MKKDIYIIPIVFISFAVTTSRRQPINVCENISFLKILSCYIPRLAHEAYQFLTRRRKQFLDDPGKELKKKKTPQNMSYYCSECNFVLDFFVMYDNFV